MTAERPVHPHIRLIVAGLMLSMFLVALDGTIVSTAMPTIAGDLNGFALYAWVPSVYLLTQTVTTPLYGKVSDLFGRKHVLFAGIGLFLLGSITSGAAPSMQLLIDSVLCRFDIPKIYLHDMRGIGQHDYDVTDGQQRLR